MPGQVRQVVDDLRVHRLPGAVAVGLRMACHQRQRAGQERLVARQPVFLLAFDLDQGAHGCLPSEVVTRKTQLKRPWVEQIAGWCADPIA